MTSVMQYLPGKGLTSRFCFKSNPETRISKQVVNTFKNALTEQNVERFIAIQVGDAFIEIAKTHDITLVEVIQECVKAEEEREPTVGPINTKERLASILSGLAPDLSPEELADHFRSFNNTLPAAVTYLHECMARNTKNGMMVRNEEGHILLRANGKKVAPKVEETINEEETTNLNEASAEGEVK